MSTELVLLEIAVVVAVIAVVLYWVVVLPARERKRRLRERKPHAGAGPAWDPELDKSRRNR